MIDQAGIFKSGFVVAFLDQFYEDKNHSYYPDKDRLLYVLCDSEEEKRTVTEEQIRIEKAKIKELGFEELSFAYLLSISPENIHNRTNSQNQYNFWLNRFAEEFENRFDTFTPIIDYINHLESFGNTTENLIEDESYFWRNYPEHLKPKIQNLLNNITDETSIHVNIDLGIEEFDNNGYWDIDFEEFKTYVDVSKPIEILFKLAELLVSLSRLEMFKSFSQEDKDIDNKDEYDSSEINMDKNKTELQRLFTNLQILRQIRFQYENKVFQYNMSVEYYTVLLQELSTKKVQFLSFCMEMPDSWVYEYNNDVKEIYAKLKKAYQDNAEYFTELHKMATDKLNEAKLIESKVIENQNIDSLQFRNKGEESKWFEVGMKFADGTIKYKPRERASFEVITINAGLSVTLRPYVSETYSNSKTTSKNIFSNKNKMTVIYNHCITNNVVISEWFLNEYRKFEE